MSDDMHHAPTTPGWYLRNYTGNITLLRVEFFDDAEPAVWNGEIGDFVPLKMWDRNGLAHWFGPISLPDEYPWNRK